ncbi:MAG: hypothetical protein IRY95_01060 [Clostridia bacterium]|nr:hypothetical protein [Clostridia bacterium]
MTPRRNWFPTLALLVALTAPVTACTWTPARRPPSPAPGPDGARVPAPDASLEVAHIVREQTGRNDVAAVVVGNVALVGLGAPPGKTPGTAPPTTPRLAPPGVERPRPHAAQPSENAVDAVVVGPLDGRVADAVRARYPYIRRLLVTDDPDLSSRIASLARDLQLGRPIDRRLREIVDVAEAVERRAGGQSAAAAAGAGR